MTLSPASTYALGRRSDLIPHHDQSLRWHTNDAAQGAAHENPCRLRADLQLLSGHANDTDGQRPLFPRVDIIMPDHVTSEPAVAIAAYRDGFGNWCNRIVAPRGRIAIRGNGLIRDTGQLDDVVKSARQVAIPNLPDEALVFLLSSRYCETDRLSEIAWGLFGQTPLGWARAQAICDFVHRHIVFGYENALAAA